MYSSETDSTTVYAVFVTLRYKFREPFLTHVMAFIFLLVMCYQASLMQHLSRSLDKPISSMARRFEDVAKQKTASASSVNFLIYVKRRGKANLLAFEAKTTS